MIVIFIIFMISIDLIIFSNFKFFKKLFYFLKLNYEDIYHLFFYIFFYQFNYINYSKELNIFI